MDLKSKLLDPAQTVLLYGTTPPRLGTPDEQVSAAAGKLAARIAALPLDGVVVYDIQDETGRTQLPRPFPFMHTIDPRQYSMQLMQSTRSEEHTSELQSRGHLVCRLLLEKKK